LKDFSSGTRRNYMVLGDSLNDLILEDSSKWQGPWTGRND